MAKTPWEISRHDFHETGSEEKLKENKVYTVNSSGEKLAGIETLPEGKGKFPAVILVHGIGVDKNEYGMFVDLAKILAGKGIATYRFDFSGCGESEGKIGDTTLTKLNGDLEKILEFVKKRENIDSTRIGIIAQSFGTCCTIALKPKVKCIVLTGSIAHPTTAFVKYFGDGYNPAGTSTKRKETGLVLKVEPKFWQDFKNYNLQRDLKEIHCPILFIHGSADDKIPPSETDTNFNSANEPKEIAIIEGADHGMRPKRKKMYEVVVKWLEKNLR